MGLKILTASKDIHYKSNFPSHWTRKIDLHVIIQLQFNWKQGMPWQKTVLDSHEVELEREETVRFAIDEVCPNSTIKDTTFSDSCSISQRTSTIPGYSNSPPHPRVLLNKMYVSTHHISIKSDLMLWLSVCFYGVLALLHCGNFSDSFKPICLSISYGKLTRSSGENTLPSHSF